MTFESGSPAQDQEQAVLWSFALGSGCNLVTEVLSTCKALGLIPSAKQPQQKQNKNNYPVSHLVPGYMTKGWLSFGVPQLLGQCGMSKDLSAQGSFLKPWGTS